jgi:hypothetical protein
MSAVQHGGELDLNAINLKAYGVEPLTRDELNFAASLTSSPEARKAITANGILLLAGDALQQRAALGRLRAICQEGRQHGCAEGEAALVAILEFLFRWKN